MPRLSLTDFVDVVTRSGSAKVTKISQIKNRPAYSPQTDFYKAVRECIVEMNEKVLPKPHLEEMLGKLKDAKKITPNVPVERLTAGLRGELAYIAAVWNDL